MRLSATNLVTISLALTAVASALSQRPGDLVVTPTRVLLDDKTKSGDITLVNRGSQTMRYRLSFVDMEMGEDGALHRVSSIDNSAAPILRLSPREIVLEPGVSQRIKVAAYFPIGSGDKELRSHLCFEPIATPRSGGSRQVETGLRVSLDVRSVVTIPVIAHHGRLFATTAISEAALSSDNDGSAVRFRLARTGSRTIRGDVNVAFVPSNGGAKTPLGYIAGLPVYFPNPSRIVTVRLNRDIRSLGKGEIEISFAEAERSRGAAMARAVVELPK
jgi:hypothetical protein